MAEFLRVCGLVAALAAGVQGCGIEGLRPAVVEGIIAVESGGNPLALRINFGKGYSLYAGTLSLARRVLAAAASFNRR